MFTPPPLIPLPLVHPVHPLIQQAALPGPMRKCVLGNTDRTEDKCEADLAGPCPAETGHRDRHSIKPHLGSRRVGFRSGKVAETLDDGYLRKMMHVAGTYVLFQVL